MTKFIPIAKPYIAKQDIKLGLEALTNGWNEKHSFYVKKFEKNFKKKIKSRYSIATSSCTGALTIAIASLGLKKGSEIILSNINWIATVSPIANLGFKPVFCDIDLKNWCIDPLKLKTLINKNTGAIIVTHLYGNLCDMEKIMKISKEKKIPVIEDAAEALGSKYKNKYAGTIGDIGCFSFHASKSLTTGEGGMMIMNKKKIYNKAKKLSDHGRSKNNYNLYLPDEIGFKFKMTNFQAALGISQLKRFKKIILRKREIFKYYKNGLKILNFNFNYQNKKDYNSYWLTSIYVNENENFSFKNFRKYMLKRKIDVRNFFPPLSKLKMFNSKKNYKNSFIVSRNSFNIPSHIEITKKQMDMIINSIKKYFKK